MRNDETTPPNLGEVIGRNVRRIRVQNGWSQDRLARVLREHGLDMTRSAVAALERAGRVFDIGEFALLVHALGSPADLLAGNGQVKVAQTAEIGLNELATALAGLDEMSLGRISTPESRVGEARVEVARILHDPVFQRATARATRRLFELFPDTRASVIGPMQASGRGDAEQKMAHRVGVPAEHLGMLAFLLWGRSLTDEREERVTNRLSHETSERSARMIRAHVTRQLEQEIRARIEKEGLQWPR